LDYCTILKNINLKFVLLWWKCTKHYVIILYMYILHLSILYF